MKDTKPSQIRELFRTRDDAVRAKDRSAFLSTQLTEIPNSGSAGYFSTDGVSSNIIHIHPAAEDPSLTLALVKEEYRKGGSISHVGYLLYFLREVEPGTFKVADIAWSNRY